MTEITQQFCGDCGARLSPGDSFCEMCGARAGSLVIGQLSAQQASIPSQFEQVRGAIPFQQAITGPFKGRSCTLVLMPDGIIVARQLKIEESVVEQMETSISDALVEEVDLFEGGQVWEIAAAHSELFLPTFHTHPPPDSGQLDRAQNIMENELIDPTWTRYARMNKEDIMCESPQNYLILYDMIEQIRTSRGEDNLGELSIQEKGRSHQWSCGGATYPMVKAAISAAFNNGLSQQAVKAPGGREDVIGVLADCTLIPSKDMNSVDCIITPHRMVFLAWVPSCAETNLGLNLNWYQEATEPGSGSAPSYATYIWFANMLARAGINADEVTLPDTILSEIGDSPKSPWKIFYLRPLQSVIEEANHYCIVPIRSIKSVKITPNSEISEGLLFRSKQQVDIVAIELVTTTFSFYLPVGSADHAVQVLSKVLPGRVKVV